MNAAPQAARTDAVRSVAAGLKRRWRRGEPADAVAAIAEYPDLARYKSVVIDLAYEEYLLQEKVGAAPDPVAFADRFPAFRASILGMLNAHRMLIERPELLDPAAEAWPEVGSAVEGLELLAELGQGTFGRAYLAFDPTTDRLCALKLAAGGSAEARVIGRLAHPHVTDVYWARPVGGRTAVCMPFVGISTLGDVISAAFPSAVAPPPPRAGVILEAAEADGLAGQADRRSVPVVRPGDGYLVGACAVAARIADAVAYLHNEGVVHGDLKPSNVVVGPGGAPHLIDFNLATSEVPLAALRGTPAYMAPELLDAALAGRAVVGIDSKRADVYSLGVVLFEFLTGRLPFPLGKSGTLADLVDAAHRGRPVFPPTIPAAVVRVVASCLDLNPAARPASAGVVAEALDRFVGHQRGRRRRSLRFVAALTGVALLTSAGAVGLKAWRATPAVVERPADPDPERPEEFFDRGVRSLRAGQPTTALRDFVTARERGDSPRALAFAAYCLALAGQNEPAAGMGRQAIGEGVTSAEVHNIVGFALTQSSRPAAAIPYLDDALRLSPKLQAALYNRAVARYRAGHADNLPESDPRCAADITAALAAGPGSAELHFDAARIYAATSGREPAHRATALTQLRLAARMGKDPGGFRRDLVLRTNLSSDPEFEVICSGVHVQSPGKSPQLRLVEPPGG